MADSKAGEMRLRLRARMARSGSPILLPGAANALAARVVEECGFEAVYVTGAGIANTFLGVPDIGLVTLDELVAHTEAIADAVKLPLVVDADTGFGNAIGVMRAVRRLERAGASAIQLEDQRFPKRCGHFDNKEVISSDEAASKIAAAAEARSDPGLVIIARTDAAATEGLASAVERARSYVLAGADAVFIEAPSTKEDLIALPGLLPGVPMVANLVEGGKTPLVPIDELSGFTFVLYANAALQGAVHGMRQVLVSLQEKGVLDPESVSLARWDERQALVHKQEFDELESRFR
ncbi:MAG: isocitrate lyase/phosphoenolpyruvate mutase family protein [Nitrospiraceae bacterium]|nr:isocitrate lyase/phosphoenolpyruvate mutase family protein [Nitrospiraceae bacterium]MDA8262947.1 isocitrate lyase/phosphoenolpyruvate mutase family protein [Actinomycetota bacterium]